MKILLIDDDAPLRRSLQRGLQARGHAVETAGSVDEARKRLAHELPEVIISDEELGWERGSEFLASLAHRLPNTHLALLTGNTTYQLPASLAAAGVVLLRKPCSVQEMLAAVLPAPQPLSTSS